MSLNPDQFYGRGVDHMFPADASPVQTTPWPRAGRDKRKHDYDAQAVGDAIRSSPALQDVDPRSLHSTQPGITSPGVKYYTKGEYEKSGKTFSDPGSAGNRYPVVYNRNEGHRVTSMLLSGHHRAAAALAEGRPLQAIVVDGGWGASRVDPSKKAPSQPAQTLQSSPWYQT